MSTHDLDSAIERLCGALQDAADGGRGIDAAET